jgi:four helix bundle protein
LSEPYGQKTDRHFAHFLFVARGEAQEMRGHLRSAYIRRCISEDELVDLQARYKEVAKMLSGLARHLKREDRKFRA